MIHLVYTKHLIYRWTPGGNDELRRRDPKQYLGTIAAGKQLDGPDYQEWLDILAVLPASKTEETS